MGHARHEIVDRLYRAALKVDPEHREVFLREVCEGDELVLKEVEQLLILDEDVAAFVNRPTTDLRAALFGQASNLASELELEHCAAVSRGEVLANRFEIIRFIGRGGMGDVYEAKDLHLGEHIALKTIRAEFAANERMVAQFKQEILLAKKVTHPNVCRIHDVGFHVEAGGDENRSDSQRTTDAKMFLTMELLKGETLASHIQGHAMEESEALPVIEQMAAGLTAAHQAGVVHRDFKSANVLLVPSEDGRIRAVITDFGLARRVHRDPKGTRSWADRAYAGTPGLYGAGAVHGRRDHTRRGHLCSRHRHVRDGDRSTSVRGGHHICSSRETSA